jgi:protein tyrosine phosphatase (PTP) superfamily phosphohydrolase (DUF442 family)
MDFRRISSAGRRWRGPAVAMIFAAPGSLASVQPGAAHVEKKVTSIPMSVTFVPVDLRQSRFT